MIKKFASTSNIVRFVIKKASDGTPLTGMTIASAGLIISTICDNEATAAAYTQAGGTLQTIATLGTFAAPSANNCRFKEVDSTNHPGLYEFQFLDARFAITGAKSLIITVSGFTGILVTDYEIELVRYDPQDAVTLGLSAVNAAIVSIGAGVDFSATMKGDLTNQAALASAVQALILSDSTPFPGADIALIQAKTTNLPASPAAVGSQMDLVNAPNATALIALAAAIKAAVSAGHTWDHIMAALVGGMTVPPA
jgi:hypothetical protein